MPTNFDRIRRYYAEEHDEWGRLETDLGSFEWATTSRRLADFLPPPPVDVLDLGGGPGRYAIWLAQRGYRVTVADLTPEMVQQAMDRSTDAGVSITAVEANAVDLSRFATDQFETAIALGPFYHLLDPAERSQAARELIRVCRPGALVAVMLLNRTAGFLDLLASGQMDLFAPQFEATWERIFSAGVYENPGENEGFFIDNYSVWPMDARREMEQHGFVTDALVGCEGVLVRFPQALEMAADRQWEWQAIWRHAYRFEEHPDFLIFSPHLLWLGRSPK